MFTHKKLTELLDYSIISGKFYWKRQVSNPRFRLVGKEAGTINKGYIDINIQGKIYGRGRLAWFYINKEWPTYYTDHINRIRGCDGYHNLRDIPQKLNSLNTDLFKHNTSGHTGVHFDKRRNNFMAYLSKKYLGSFKSFEEAVEARKFAVSQKFKKLS